jgi:hypothetical protein
VILVALRLRVDLSALITALSERIEQL